MSESIRFKGWKALRLSMPAMGMTFRSSPAMGILYLTLTAFSALSPIVGAWLTKAILDCLIGQGTWAGVVGLTAALAGLGILNSLLPQISRYLISELSRRTALIAQDQLCKAINRLQGISKFEDPAFLDRVRIAQQSGGSSSSQIFDMGWHLILSILATGGFLGSIFIINSFLAVILLASAVPALIAEIFLSRRRVETTWRVSSIFRRETFYGELLGSANSAKEIRLFGIGDFLGRKMLSERRIANLHQRKIDQQVLVVQSMLGVISAFIVSAGLLSMVTSAQRGKFTAGDVSLFLAATGSVLSYLIGLISQVGRIYEQILLFGNYQRLLEGESDIPTHKSLLSIEGLRRGVEFRNVWFRYTDSQPWILKGVSFAIPYGKSIALVGRSGSGKSTIVKLLCRFYDPTDGDIFWDGINIRSLDPDAIRRQIGAVFQDYMCYEMTAEENIFLGDLSAQGKSDRVESAAVQAGIHDELTLLPYGYGTMLSRNFFGENGQSEFTEGVMLSGGQWQRVALARGMMRINRDLLILDEPSSGLDAEAEYAIHKRLQAHRANQASLLISHRLSAVRDADMIIVIADGSVIEQGTHEKLIGLEGTYAKLFFLQAKGYQDSLSVE